MQLNNDSKPCCNCGVEIAISKQICPSCNVENPWTPDLGIKPYLSRVEKIIFILAPATYSLIYLYITFDIARLHPTIVFIFISTLFTFFSVYFYHPKFELARLFMLAGFITATSNTFGYLQVVDLRDLKSIIIFTILAIYAIFTGIIFAQFEKTNSAYRHR